MEELEDKRKEEKLLLEEEEEEEKKWLYISSSVLWNTLFTSHIVCFSFSQEARVLSLVRPPGNNVIVSLFSLHKLRAYCRHRIPPVCAKKQSTLCVCVCVWCRQPVSCHILKASKTFIRLLTPPDCARDQTSIQNLVIWPAVWRIPYPSVHNPNRGKYNSSFLVV